MHGMHVRTGADGASASATILVSIHHTWPVTAPGEHWSAKAGYNLLLASRSQVQVCRAGVATAVGAMAAPAWEIRNSASLAFTALLMRTVGFRNVAKVQAHLPWSISSHACLQACLTAFEHGTHYLGRRICLQLACCCGSITTHVMACCGMW